jgi:hypothetical protein
MIEGHLRQRRLANASISNNGNNRDTLVLLLSRTITPN